MSQFVPRVLKSILTQIGLFTLSGATGFIIVVYTGNSARLLFPLTTLLIALVLVLRGWIASYVTYCLWLFIITPFLRRYSDLLIGWSDVNLIMLAPYSAAGISVLVVSIMLFHKPFPGLKWFCLIVLVSFYGLLVAISNGRLSSGFFDFVRYIVPPMFAALIIANGKYIRDLDNQLIAFCKLAMILVGAYGIYQYFIAPVWDREWMLLSNMDSIGSPEPMQIRVFSTLNSPGSLAQYLMFGICILLSSNGVFRWIGITLAIIALGLSTVRATWIATALVLIIITIFGQNASRLSILSLIGAGFLVSSALLINPIVNETITTRLETFSNVSEDVSFVERSAGYSKMLDNLIKAPNGKGLAIAGALKTRDGEEATTIDGGPIEFFLAFGFFGGIVYMLSITALLITAIVNTLKSHSNIMIASMSNAIGVFLLLASGTTTAGEVGIIFWISIALCLRNSPRDFRKLKLRFAAWTRSKKSVEMVPAMPTDNQAAAKNIAVCVEV